MPKKLGVALVTLGAVLILSALLLFLHNQREDEQAGEQAEALLTEVEQIIEQRSGQSALSPRDPLEAENVELSPEMPVVEQDGFQYVGYLDIPVIDLKLPVLTEWDYIALKAAPCHQSGSSRTDDLVIAGHNYRRHFKRLSELTPGDTVQFTDMDGIVNLYYVTRVDTLDPYDVDAVLSSDSDLVLYTCTPGGKMRVGVFCDRTAPMPSGEE